MTVLAWIIVLPLFLALVAQVAFCVIGISGLGATLYARMTGNSISNISVADLNNKSKY